MIAVLASCVAWIGIFSFGVVIVLGTSVTTGWMVAGSLLILTLAGCRIVFQEIRQAGERPGYLTRDDRSARPTNSGEFRRSRFRTLPIPAEGIVLDSCELVLRRYSSPAPKKLRSRPARPRPASPV